MSEATHEPKFYPVSIPPGAETYVVHDNRLWKVDSFELTPSGYVYDLTMRLNQFASTGLSKCNVQESEIQCFWEYFKDNIPLDLTYPAVTPSSKDMNY
jgi:hypothetical protein